MWPVAKSGKPEAKRMRRDVAFGEERESAEPGPERPAAKQQERKNRSTSVETTGHLCVRALKRVSEFPVPGLEFPVASRCCR